ncbi:MAG TPA: phosphopantothenoylcysteine decarboxylase, partial [Thermoanaerobaculia bacterium]|nr:phosphopantothenoylcysteine decarboxylase [Thermoanaerobaculia bacterium]
REPIDPVRFIGNRSSGRMGFAIAAEAARRGAAVTLVAGPVSLPTPREVRRVDVETAEEMRGAVLEAARGAHLIVMAAAVADFRPREVAAAKIKKSGATPPPIALEPTVDILTELAAAAPAALRVGFAAETGDLASEARAKLERKGADLIVANDVGAPGIGFGSADNEVTVFRRDGEPVCVSRRPKEEVAKALLDLATQELAARAAAPTARC